MPKIDFARLSIHDAHRLIAAATGAPNWRDIFDHASDSGVWTIPSKEYHGQQLVIFIGLVSLISGTYPDLESRIKQVLDEENVVEVLLIDSEIWKPSVVSKLMPLWGNLPVVMWERKQITEALDAAQNFNFLDLRPWRRDTNPFEALPEGDLLRRFLSEELRADRDTHLSTTSMDPRRSLRLADIFVDLPADGTPSLCQQLLLTMRQLPGLHQSYPWKHLIVGGPGQGKTTLSSRICQLFRAALLGDEPETLTAEIRDLVDAHQKALKNQPIAHLLPIQVSLPRFADALAEGVAHDLDSYILYRVQKRIDQPIRPETVRAWTEQWPQVLVLDGLDEVPASANRTAVLQAVAAYIQHREAMPLRVVATTRPQGYRGELDGNDWKSWRLINLPPDVARVYGQNLLRLWTAGDALELDLQQRRLERAFSEPATAALTNTPLQVLILALLLSQTGRAPKDRWRLFGDYYRVIFDRERDREIPAARVLQDLPEFIHQLHWEVGYRLQLRAEMAGDAQAMMPRAELMALIRQRLGERGLEAEYRAEVERNLDAALLDRLVFLTAPEADVVSFELRSLQEMCAAERFFQGPEELLRKRLWAIAGSAHWRNVFLFCVGRIAAEREHLLPDILDFCTRLNSTHPSSTFTELNIAQMGTRLAMDLLGEPAIQSRPRERDALLRLVTVALQRFDTALIRDIIKKWVETDIPLLQRVLRKLLEDKTWRPLWKVLVSEFQMADGLQDILDDVFHIWPEDVAQIIDDPFEQRFEFDFKRALDYPSRIQRRVLSIAHLLTALQIIHLTRGIFQNIHALTQSDENWFNKFKNRRTIEIGIILPEAVKHNVAAHIKSLQQPIIKNINFPTYYISKPILSALSYFYASPDKEGLSKTLMALHELPILELQKYIQWLPWQITACLAEPHMPLDTLASLAKQGTLGDTRDWALAEERWDAQGVNLEDDFTWPDGLPFTADIRVKGVPPRFSVTYWTISLINPSDILTNLPHWPKTEFFWATILIFGKSTLARQADFWTELPYLPLGLVHICVIASEAGWPAPARAWFESHLHQERPPIWGNKTQEIPNTPISIDPSKEPGLLSVFASCRTPEVLSPLKDVEHWRTESLPPRVAADVLLIQLMLGKVLEPQTFAATLVVLHARLGDAFEQELISILTSPSFKFSLPLLLELAIHFPIGTLSGPIGTRLAQELAALPSPLLTNLDLSSSLNLPRPQQKSMGELPAIELLMFRIRGIRALGDLDLDLRPAKELGGFWTCIVGLNGAGKTTLLQCLCIALLGPDRPVTFGDGLIADLRAPNVTVASLELKLRIAEKTFAYTLLINGGTVKLKAGSEHVWNQVESKLHRALFVSYGANRNLSNRRQQEDESRSAELRRHLSLFDASAPLANAEVLRIKGAMDSNVAHLFIPLVEKVFQDYGLKAKELEQEIVFQLPSQTSGAKAIALPDGFRATAAWLADLCRVAVEQAGDSAWGLRLETLQGVVLIDEIDLHLHARLQRALVNHLRNALPKIQWVVTTHSPLVLSSFSQQELRVLNRENEGGLWIPDRPIYGFTVDEIIQYLLDTSPTSVPFEDLLEDYALQGSEAPKELRDRVALAQEVSPTIDKDEALLRILRRRRQENSKP